MGALLETARASDLESVHGLALVLERRMESHVPHDAVDSEKIVYDAQFVPSWRTGACIYFIIQAKPLPGTSIARNPLAVS